MVILCPYCFEKIKEQDLHYLCADISHKGSEPDGIYAKYSGNVGFSRVNNHIVTKVSSFRKPICDSCHKPLKRKLCPYCHNILPHGIEEMDPIFFAVLGPRAVGKSHYIGVLIDTLRKMGSEFGWTLTFANTESMGRYERMYYRPLFENRTVLKGTKKAVDESYSPIACLLTLPNRKTVGLFFIDTAGEDLKDDNDAYVIERYISNASGIIYLVDPLQFDMVRTRIGGKSSNKADFTETLGLINQVYHAGNGMRINKKVRIPLAVVLTKCDVLTDRKPSSDAEEEILLGSDSAIKIPRVRDGMFDDPNSRQIDAELEDYIARVTEGVLTTAVDNFFSNHRYFAVSALGQDPKDNKLDQGVSPVRVEDPFLWMLSEIGVLKTRRR